jgi:hypothetical protein
MGAFPVPYSEIAAWCQLYGERLSVWEMYLLHRMEAPRLTFLNAPAEQKAEPLTPSLFKSMFDKAKP